MAAGAVVELEGYTQMLRAFGKLDKSLARDLKTEVRGIARDVAVAAKAEAVAQGLGKPGRSGRGTGNLVRHIKYGATARYAYIKEDALKVSKKYPSGYPYARVYEYGNGGVRAFMAPTVTKMTPFVVSRVDAFVKHAAAAAGL